MSSWSQPIEENGKFRQWPWEEEGISAPEYEQSLQGLKRFVSEVKLRDILNLEDLSAAASLVGHDIAVVIVTKGWKMMEQASPQILHRNRPHSSPPIHCGEECGLAYFE